MNTEGEKGAIDFANWLWHNYICYYGGDAGQWLGHTDSKPYTTEELYYKWSKLVQSREQSQEHI